MSESDSGPGNREVAQRLFAAEYDDADLSYSESEEERAPNYVVTPTGARVNRVFVVGVLTEIETVSEDYLRARVVDPTGPFVVYAGQYQPDALAFLERADPPTFVAVTGKARTYQPEDSERVFTSVRPESINEVDADTRDRWVVDTAERTLERVGVAATAKRDGREGEDLRGALEAAGVGESLAAGLPRALDHYGTTGDYLDAVAALSRQAAAVVAGERDEVDSLSLAPDDGGDDPLGSLAADLDLGDEPAVTEPTVDEGATETAVPDESAGTAEAQTETGRAATDSAETAESEAPESASAETTTEPPETGETTESTSGETAESTEASEAVESTTEPGETTEPTAEGEGEAEDLEFDAEFELGEDEREEIESEYGTEFQSGSEVDEPGAADIDTPAPDEGVEAGEADGTAAESAPSEGESPTAETASTDSTTGPESTVEAGGEGTTEPERAASAAGETGEGATGEEPTEGASVTASEAEPAADVDLEDAVMDAMDDLDEGDGAPRQAVLDAVVDRTGADPADVEAAIQDALMSGRCYEPDDETLKAI